MAKKRAKTSRFLDPKRSPRIPTDADVKEKTKNRTIYLSKNRKFLFTTDSCSIDALKKVLERVRNFETMTWGEIEGNRHHSIQKDILSKDAKDRLVKIKLGDIDEVFSLAIDGRKRVIGIRERDVFKFLWWDPDHRVCPSVIRHT